MSTARLTRLARAPAQAQAQATASASASPSEPERCDMCAEPVAPEHRHLLDVEHRRLLCACRACAILFDRPAAAQGRLRLIPDRRLALERFALDDSLWERLRIPVGLAFFFSSTAAGRVVAFYPGPMGTTESLLELDAWEALVAANPILRALEPDVEALLVDRARGAARHFLVPVDDCYALAGLMRGGWRGLNGGDAVWRDVDAYFDRLERRARTHTNEGATWPTT